MTVFPDIHTSRLDLIEIRQEHLIGLYHLFRNQEVTRFYNLNPLNDKEEAQKLLYWFQDRFKTGLGIRWGIALKGGQDIIGTAGFNNFTKGHKANIGYDLEPAYWNKGYMAEALEAIIDFGFNHLQVNRIEAEVMPGNIASEKLLGKLNFKKEGILRQWMLWNGKHYDMIMFSLLKTDWVNDKAIKK